ncbi:hypothetical protein BH11BAC6_BH11BAC6_06160 [soil metagenome]
MSSDSIHKQSVQITNIGIWGALIKAKLVIIVYFFIQILFISSGQDCSLMKHVMNNFSIAPAGQSCTLNRKYKCATQVKLHSSNTARLTKNKECQRLFSQTVTSPLFLRL